MGTFGFSDASSTGRDRLSDAYEGNLETGLYFAGSNGYRADKLLSVKELMKKLVYGEDS